VPDLLNVSRVYSCHSSERTGFPVSLHFFFGPSVCHDIPGSDNFRDPEIYGLAPGSPANPLIPRENFPVNVVLKFGTIPLILKSPAFIGIIS
jgi:hypothetical protein